MNIALRISIIVAVIAYFIILFVFLKKRKLELKYSILWIAFGVVPQLITNETEKLGIADGVNGILAIAIFSLMMILMSLTAIVSKMKESIKKLTQMCAIYEERIRQLEKHD